MKYKSYLGLDAHSKNCYFVVRDRKGQIVRRAMVKTTEVDLLGFVRSIEGNKGLILEESSISQWIFILLHEEVDEIAIINPASRGKAQGPKNDFLDAAELAEAMRKGNLKTVYHSADERMELRTLVSGYDDLVQEISRTKNRLKALFRRTAIPTSRDAEYKQKALLERLPSENERFVGGPLFEQIELLEKQKQLYHERFEANMKNFKEMKLLKSIPGFDRVRVNQVVGIVVTPHRFPSRGDFLAYSMLVKHKKLSDGKLYGQRQPRGKLQLKMIFKMAAKNVVRGENSYRRKYDQVLKDKGDERAAMNAVARKLAFTFLAVWKSGKKYNDHYLEEKVRKGKQSKKA